MSVPGDLTAAVKSRLEAVLTGWAVTVRKTATRVEGDPDKLVVVSLGTEVRRPATSDLKWFAEYPVAVALSAKAPGKLTGLDIAADRAAAEAAVTSLRAVRALVPALDGLTYQGQPFYGRGGLDRGIDWSAFGVTYRLWETVT